MLYLLSKMKGEHRGRWGLAPREFGLHSQKQRLVLKFHKNREGEYFLLTEGD